MLTSALSPNVVKTALDELFKAEYNFMDRPEYPSAMNPRVFMQASSSKASETVEALKGPGYFSVRGELSTPDEKQPIATNQVTFTHLNYAAGTKISKNFFDDDQHNMWQSVAREFGLAGRKSRDLHAFEVYRSGFSRTYGDGVALFGSHTINGGTQSNTSTIKITEPNLDTAIQALLTQKGLDGTIAGSTPSCILVTQARLKGTAIILDSELRSASSDNDANIYSSRYGIMLYATPWTGASVSAGANITAGDDDYWFLLSRMHGITRYNRQDIETRLIDWKIREDETYYYSAEFRQSVGARDWVGSWGSTGADGTYDT